MVPMAEYRKPKLMRHKDESSSSSSCLRDVLLVGLAVLVLMQSIWSEEGIMYNVMQDLSSSSENPVDASISTKTKFLSGVHLCPTQPIYELSQRGLLMSQKGEDRELLNWFNGLCGGTYIEAGGLDGRSGSNTYVFNQAFGWKGLLIELSPISFAELQINRPNELGKINAAICESSDVLHFFDAGKILNDPAVNGVWEFAPDDHKRSFWKYPNHTIEECDPIQCEPLQNLIDYTMEQVARQKNTTTTPTRSTTSTSIIGAAGTTNDPIDSRSNEKYFFDIFSLDVEGAEYEVLNTIDFDRVGFGMVVVENEGNNHRKLTSVRTLLEKNGYTFLHKHECNEWYIHQDFHEIYRDFIMKA